MAVDVCDGCTFQHVAALPVHLLPLNVWEALQLPYQQQAKRAATAAVAAAAGSGLQPCCRQASVASQAVCHLQTHSSTGLHLPACVPSMVMIAVWCAGVFAAVACSACLCLVMTIQHRLPVALLLLCLQLAISRW